MLFLRWGHLIWGCWDSPNYLQNRPGILILWKGETQPEEAISFSQSDSVINQGKEMKEKGLWYSAIYTEKLTSKDRQNLIKEIERKNRGSSE